MNKIKAFMRNNPEYAGIFFFVVVSAAIFFKGCLFPSLSDEKLSSILADIEVLADIAIAICLVGLTSKIGFGQIDAQKEAAKANERLAEIQIDLQKKEQLKDIYTSTYGACKFMQSFYYNMLCCLNKRMDTANFCKTYRSNVSNLFYTNPSIRLLCSDDVYHSFEDFEEKFGDLSDLIYELENNIKIEPVTDRELFDAMVSYGDLRDLARVKLRNIAFLEHYIETVDHIIENHFNENSLLRKIKTI